MATYITIDGGTTNTRISLVENLKVIDTLKFGVGARAGIDDKKILESTVKNGIIDILKNNKKSETDITRILASGMITSEFGLCQLDHITAPAGIKELNATMHEVILENISEIPFVFIRRDELRRKGIYVFCRAEDIAPVILLAVKSVGE